MSKCCYITLKHWYKETLSTGVNRDGIQQEIHVYSEYEYSTIIQIHVNIHFALHAASILSYDQEFVKDMIHG